ncbi:hypothetical protein ACEPPN_006608 [Leptodophora sp. 'Broadleaf-Isolate-01']
MLGLCLVAVQASLEDKRLLKLEQSLRLFESPQLAFFDATRTILDDCINVLSRLDSMIFGVKKEGKTPGFLRKPVAAWKLSLGEDDIAEARDTIKVYTAAMQMALSSLNTSLLVRSSPDVETREVGAVVDSVPRSVHTLQENIKRSTSISKPSLASTGSSNQNHAKRKHLEKYIEIVEELRSNVTTYIGSTNGSVAGDQDYEESVAGEFPSEDGAARVRIAQWSGGHATGGWISEEKEDHSKMMIGRRMDLAQSKMAAKQYGAAEKLYTKCIAEMGLSPDCIAHEAHGSREICMKLFEALKNQKKYAEGLRVLDTLAKYQGPGPADLCLLTHLRAQVLLEQKKPEDALPHALEAMRSRYEMSDDSRHLYIESSNLVADTYSALGDKEEAELYRQCNNLSKEGLLKESSTTSVHSNSSKQKVISLLSQDGHDLSCPEGINESLIWAIRNQNESALRLCLDQGADVNCPSSNGWTPLHYAASIGSDSHVEILLNLGAQVNVCAGLHWTPLMVAVYNEYSETAKILIAHGADLEAKSADGETVLQIARSRSLFTVAAMQREEGATG